MGLLIFFDVSNKSKEQIVTTQCILFLIFIWQTTLIFIVFKDDLNGNATIVKYISARKKTSTEDMQNNREIMTEYAVGEYELENLQTWNDMLLSYAEHHKKLKSEKLEILLDTLQIHENMLRKISEGRKKALSTELLRLECEDGDLQASRSLIESNYKLAFDVENVRYNKIFLGLQQEYRDFSRKFLKYCSIKDTEDLSTRYSRYSTNAKQNDMIWEDMKVDACLERWAANNLENMKQQGQIETILSSLDLSDETAAKFNIHKYGMNVKKN